LIHVLYNEADVGLLVATSPRTKRGAAVKYMVEWGSMLGPLFDRKVSERCYLKLMNMLARSSLLYSKPVLE
jgi:hypothetical protein